jgi:hypothetical protein
MQTTPGTVSRQKTSTCARIAILALAASHGCSSSKATPLTPSPPLPPSTYLLTGFVREPGQGGLPLVRVTFAASQQTTMTDMNGEYVLAHLPSTGAHLTFEKDQYEPVELDATQDNPSVAMQRIIRIVAGETVTPLTLRPHDLSYQAGSDRCYPCRLIRVVAPRDGLLRFQVTWTEPHSTLDVWAAGQRFRGNGGASVAEIPVNAGEVVIYIGANSADYGVLFTIETTLSAFSTVTRT